MRTWSRRRLRVALAWIELQWQRHDKDDHQFALLRMEVASVRSAVVAGAGGRPRRTKLKDHYLKFEQRRRGPETEQQAARRVAQSKATWFQALGLDKEGNWIGSPEHRRQLAHPRPVQAISV